MTVLEVCMYSGVDWDPKIELPFETSEILMEKINKLSKKIENNMFGMPNPNNYMVVFNSYINLTVGLFTPVIDFNERIPLIYCRPGKVFVYHKQNNTYQLDCYEDDQNIHSLLSDWAIPALMQHNKEAAKTMEEFNNAISWHFTYPMYPWF